MAYTEKDWKDSPLTTTPLSAAAMEDLEMRTTDYVATYAQGVNVWESEANPASVTDWGPVINALLVAGYRYLYFGLHDFPFSTPIDVGYSGVTFRGEANNGWFPPASGMTRLRYTGTGSGTAITVGPLIGVTFENLAITHTAAFTGTLIACYTSGDNGSTDFLMRRCYVGYAALAQTITAAIGVDLRAAINSVFECCTFMGLLTSVRGYTDAAPPYWSNGAVFRDCVFSGQCQYSVLNPGDQWRFDGCIFESVGAADQTVDAHIRMASGSTYGNSLTLRDCTHWDAGSAATIWVDQVASHNSSVLIENCVEHNANLTKSMQLLGNGFVQITGGYFASAIDVGDGSVGAQRKMSLILHGFWASTVANLYSGHTAIDVAGLRTDVGGVSRHDAARSRSWMEIADSNTAAHAPTFTVPAGAPSDFTCGGGGTDRAGLVTADYTGAGTSGTGQIAQVAFGSPPSGHYPRVILTPLNAKTIATGWYLVRDDNNPGYFRIAITVGIAAAGGSIEWNYQVVWG